MIHKNFEIIQTKICISLFDLHFTVRQNFQKALVLSWHYTFKQQGFFYHTSKSHRHNQMAPSEIFREIVDRIVMQSTYVYYTRDYFRQNILLN